MGNRGINIDKCRIGDEKISVHDAPSGTFAGGEANRGSIKNYREHKGRFPSDLILDEEAGKMLDEQSGILKSGRRSSSYHVGNKKVKCSIMEFMENIKLKILMMFLQAEGGASRFFYCAKASKTERSMGLEDDKRNNHPTVKPVALMRYLVKLITPADGIVLDMFLGSGTTAVACILEGYNWIGIEKEKDYVEIAKARIEAVPKSLI